jgi:hypothetical protein
MREDRMAAARKRGQFRKLSREVLHLERDPGKAVWCGVNMEQVRGMTNAIEFATCTGCRERYRI